MFQSGGINWILLMKFPTPRCGLRPSRILERLSVMKFISLTWKEPNKLPPPAMIFWLNASEYLWRVIHITSLMKKLFVIARETIGRCLVPLVQTSRRVMTSVRSHFYSHSAMARLESRLEIIFHQLHFPNYQRL